MVAGLGVPIFRDFYGNPHCEGLEEKKMTQSSRFSPTLILAVFTPQNLVPDPQKLGVRVLSDACIINPKSYLFIYAFVF